MNCRACGSSSLGTFFAMGPMPLAGAFASSFTEAVQAQRYPLEWRRCRDCGLVNVWPDVPDEVMFADYSYRSSDVPAIKAHHRAFADGLLESFPGRKRMLEIGGNDGVLARCLAPEWDVTVVDPSDVARTGDPGYRLVNESWPCAVDGPFDVITSSNAFAHFTRIGDGLSAVRDALKPDGIFIMEVHDLDVTLESGQWDTVYHEHKVEWSADSLLVAGGMHGLELMWVERLPLHGGLLRAAFRRSGVVRLVPADVSFDALQLAYYRRRPVGADVAYGASGRATVYLNQLHEPVRAVIDGSPRRYGRWIPGVGIPILPPDQLGDSGRVLITAWPHAADIKAKHPDFQGTWVTAW